MTINTSALRRRLGVAVAGAGAAAVLMTGAGLASAAPNHMMPGPSHSAPRVAGTNCTVVQVERALAKEDPALWNKINATPMRKKHFEQWLLMTPQQRKDKRAEFRKAHPQWKNHHKKFTPAEKAKMKAVKDRVIATCSQF
ncbi:hemophore-related protein [Gordonia sp. TBRC 11910]|uniref:Hemophore-related protein n=1 Tax=Gordonia asplenii TaxID=2725283 RepID=A0A848L3J3_9ACTN|nr:hemophore-related protein [Gordonia asplenii]NMO05097.1 hemophore-related protein [Gordonia asplenii]